jgi:hypothetical protein
MVMISVQKLVTGAGGTVLGLLGPKWKWVCETSKPQTAPR